MKKQKLNLDSLNVKSFVTVIPSNEKATLGGGNSVTHLIPFLSDLVCPASHDRMVDCAGGSDDTCAPSMAPGVNCATDPAVCTLDARNGWCRQAYAMELTYAAAGGESCAQL